MTNIETVQSIESNSKFAMAALQRAADQARNIAIQTDTAIVILKDGKRVRVTAEELKKQTAKK